MYFSNLKSRMIPPPPPASPKKLLILGFFMNPFAHACYSYISNDHITSCLTWTYYEANLGKDISQKNSNYRALFIAYEIKLNLFKNQL